MGVRIQLRGSGYLKGLSRKRKIRGGGNFNFRGNNRVQPAEGPRLEDNRVHPIEEEEYPTFATDEGNEAVEDTDAERQFYYYVSAYYNDRRNGIRYNDAAKVQILNILAAKIQQSLNEGNYFFFTRYNLPRPLQGDEDRYTLEIDNAGFITIVDSRNSTILNYIH